MFGIPVLNSGCTHTRFDCLVSHLRAIAPSSLFPAPTLALGRVHSGHYNATFLCWGEKNTFTLHDGVVLHCGLFWAWWHTARLHAVGIYHLCNAMVFGKYFCTNIFTAAADIAEEICNFTPRKQFMLINKTRARPIINPNILKLIQ